MILTEIKKTYLADSDGEEMVVDKTYVYRLAGRDRIGVFKGICDGALAKFENLSDKKAYNYKIFNIEAIHNLANL